MTNDFLVPMLASTSVAVAGWVTTHLLTRRRDRANKRRDQRVQFIIDAYRRLERAANRTADQAPAYYGDIESAVADVQLFGTAAQVRAARAFAAAFARDGAAPLHTLLEQLRADLRAELGLGPVADGLAHLRITDNFHHDDPAEVRPAALARRDLAHPAASAPNVSPSAPSNAGRRAPAPVATLPP